MESSAERALVPHAVEGQEDMDLDPVGAPRSTPQCAARLAVRCAGMACPTGEGLAQSRTCCDADRNDRNSTVVVLYKTKSKM